MPLFESTNFQLASRDILPRLTIAYETYGGPDASMENVILVAHGATSSHHAAGIVTPDRCGAEFHDLNGHGNIRMACRQRLTSG
jgi:homoserine acetyltransferase